MKKLRILFVDTAVDVSISDSARGYYGALVRQGHEVYRFKTSARIMFAALALKHGPEPELANNFALCSRLAAEGIVVEALRQRSDLVVISSGLALHGDGIELLNRAGFPSALILTESPYEDEPQSRFAARVGHVFTNDHFSTVQHGWTYLASAYDPEYHHPFPFETREQCDVLFVGTGWPERQQLLEGVCWDGIDLRIMGTWPTLKEDSPLWPYYTPDIVSNDEVARLYSSAKIAISQHRYHADAYSLGPRAYELGACGVYQVSDWRPELQDVYKKTVPVYDSPQKLEQLIREALADDSLRLRTAAQQREMLLSGLHTFDDRAAELMTHLTSSRMAVR